jgi:hypothetical protein
MGQQRLVSGEVDETRADDLAKDGHDARGVAHGEQWLRSQTAEFEDDARWLAALDRDAPLRLRELAILQVTQRVGRPKAVPLQKSAQQLAVACGGDRYRPLVDAGALPALLGDAGHQRAYPSLIVCSMSATGTTSVVQLATVADSNSAPLAAEWSTADRGANT